LSTIDRMYSGIHPDDRARVKDTYDAAQKQKGEFDAEYRIVLQDGTVKHLHTIGHPVLNESGDVVEYVGTGMDVTEQRQAQAALETAFDEIKRLRDRLQDENLALREEIDQGFMFEEIVGASPALKSVLFHVSMVAPTDSTVLISGETGTGKELIARAIHKHSRRADRAFISLNCAATPPSLIASELFGHEKGAFTGAVQQRRGRFELAHNGTIFLDEAGEIPLDAQVALLRVLQEGQLERVGGSRPIPVDVRVVAASNRDLSVAIAEGSFRSDLYYRLNVFPIQVPPLRKRRDDIPMLVEYFVKRFAEKMAKRINRIDRRTLELCDRYPWPGNIRELQNIVERSVILCTGDTFSIDESWLSAQGPLRAQGAGPLPETLQDQEKEAIEAALTTSRGRVAGPRGAAAKLGIPASTLESKIKRLGIGKRRF
jgi:transcriptional regulator with GAF, ATPase, and Fis domain